VAYDRPQNHSLIVVGVAFLCSVEPVPYTEIRL
jgi:hypothetical protein